MSIIAREWALNQKLGPVPKFVLVVLGDAADEQGICWPRISTIARRVGVSTRTVQRTLQHLVRSRLIAVEPRLRSDGSSSSNQYRLRLQGGDNLSSPPDKLTPPPDTPVTQGCHPCQGEGDTGVTPLTERRTEREPPLRKPMPNIENGIRDRGGGDEKGKNKNGNTALHYPRELLPAERARAESMVVVLDSPLDQQVLDEWAGIIAAREIRSSPLACLRALVRRAREGTFSSERGHRIAQARKSRQRVRRQSEHRPEPAPVDENNPLVHQVLEIRQRAQGG